MTIETGWVDKLNRWALRSIRRSAVETVITDNDGTTLVSRDGSHLIRWPEIKEISAVKQSPLASGSFALIIRTDSKMTVVDDSVTGYSRRAIAGTSSPWGVGFGAGRDFEAFAAMVRRGRL